MKNYRVFYYSALITLLFFNQLLLKSQETKPIINASLQETVVDAVTHSVKSNREGLFQFVTGLKLPVTLIVSDTKLDRL